VGRQDGETRVYVHPQSLAILKTVAEDDRLMRLIFRLHGELLIGDPGSWIVETAACWAIVMILTGLYLWWPRGAKGLGGVLWPRLHQRGRAFWRDIHAVAGIWIGLLGLGLILTGLPWANVWGGYLKEVRAITGATDGPQDWTTSSHEGHGMRAMMGDHAEHKGMTMAHPAADLAPLDRIAAHVAPLQLAGPVLIAPPTVMDGLWTAKSDSGDRPLRVKLTVDGASGTIVKREDFGDRHWIDRAVGYGVAAHEGQLFGLANQLLGMVAALGLVLLAASGAVLWWRRRPVGLLGAPLPLGRPRFGAGLTAGIVALGVLFPMFGVTLVAVLAIEWVVLRRLVSTRHWLGLRATAA
ncbi:MAG: PepSY protein, partial [Rhizorhabdus sp.]|nr:PepSY protein [Rhizorhabdus sp.]